LINILKNLHPSSVTGPLFLDIPRKRGNKLHNKRLPKNLVTFRIVATVVMLLSLILPYFELMAHSTTPFVILIALLVFYIAESRYGKKTVSE